MRSIYQNFCPPRSVTIFASIVIVWGIATAVSIALTAQEVAPVDAPDSSNDKFDKFGVYHPDRPTPRTIYATRVILRGPDVTITLDADPKTGPPGITIASAEQSVVLYLAPAARGTPARAVVGTKDRGMPNLGAAIFSSGNAGYLQIRDRNGADVMPLHEIKR